MGRGAFIYRALVESLHVSGTELGAGDRAENRAGGTLLLLNIKRVSEIYRVLV